MTAPVTRWLNNAVPHPLCCSAGGVNGVESTMEIDLNPLPLPQRLCAELMLYHSQEDHFTGRECQDWLLQSFKGEDVDAALKFLKELLT